MNCFNFTRTAKFRKYCDYYNDFEMTFTPPVETTYIHGVENSLTYSIDTSCLGFISKSILIAAIFNVIDDYENVTYYNFTEDLETYNACIELATADCLYVDTVNLMMKW